MPYGGIFFVIRVFLQKMAPPHRRLSWSSQQADRLPVQRDLACDAVQLLLWRRHLCIQGNTDQRVGHDGGRGHPLLQPARGEGEGLRPDGQRLRMAQPAQGAAQGEHRLPAAHGHAEELLQAVADERRTPCLRRLVHDADEGVHGKGRHRRGEVDKRRQARHTDAVHGKQCLCSTLCWLRLAQASSRVIQATPIGLHGVRGFYALTGA